MRRRRIRLTHLTRHGWCAQCAHGGHGAHHMVLSVRVLSGCVRRVLSLPRRRLSLTLTNLTKAVCLTNLTNPLNPLNAFPQCLLGNVQGRL